MFQIKAEKLTAEAFAPFGRFFNMDDPTGYALEGALHKFYPDRIRDSYTAQVGFSAIRVRKPEKMVIDSVEYHTTTSEIIMPLNGDMVLHVAPPSGGTPVTHLTKAFIVPRGTMVQLNPAVWHLCPLPAEVDELHALIVLQECTYANDCPVIALTDEQQFEIVL